VIALAFLVYALGEWALRRGLAGTGSSLPDQKGNYPKTHPALGLLALHLGAPGGAGGQASDPQPGHPSRSFQTLSAMPGVYGTSAS
jgi:hypothetical protein